MELERGREKGMKKGTKKRSLLKWKRTQSEGKQKKRHRGCIVKRKKEHA